MSTKNLLMSFITGAATGAVLGILFAPTSGEETRKKIVKVKNKSIENLDGFIEEGKQTWYKAKGQVGSAAGIAAEEMDEFIGHILKKGQSWWSSAKNKASEVADEAERAANEAMEEGKKAGKQVAKEGRSTVNDLQNHFS